MRPIAIRSRRRESPEETFLMRISVLTISDSVTKGEREDLSGPAVVAFCRGLGWEITSSLRVSDDPANIREQLRAVADSGRVDLLLTTGGTGLRPRDNTPEATQAVADRMAAGNLAAATAGKTHCRRLTQHHSLAYLTCRLITVCRLLAPALLSRPPGARQPADQLSLHRSISLGGGDSMSFEFPQTIGQKYSLRSFPGIPCRFGVPGASCRG